MKILYIFNRDSSDRPESAMILALREQGVDPVVICAPNTPFEKYLRSEGVNIETIEFRKKIDFCAISKIRKIVSGNNFDIVHVFHKICLINFTIASIGNSTPVIAYRGIVGNLSYLDPFSWLSFLNPRLSSTITVCEAIRKYYLSKKLLFFFKMIKPEKIVTIHKGHDISWYRQSNRPDFTQFDVPKDAYVIGCVARLKPRKGIVVLIESMPHIHVDKPVHLVLLGHVEDPRISEAIQASPLKERIHLLGFRSDARELAGGFDCLVLPSLRREGLPRAIIEGMAQGVPVVVTDSGGSPELVRDNIEGRVVPPGDPLKLADAISWILNDPIRWKDLSENAVLRIANDFNVTTTAEKTLLLYSSVLNHKGLDEHSDEVG